MPAIVPSAIGTTAGLSAFIYFSIFASLVINFFIVYLYIDSFFKSSCVLDNTGYGGAPNVASYPSVHGLDMCMAYCLANSQCTFAVIAYDNSCYLKGTLVGNAQEMGSFGAMKSCGESLS